MPDNALSISKEQMKKLMTLSGHYEDPEQAVISGIDILMAHYEKTVSEIVPVDLSEKRLREVFDFED
ncbi:hypothetical protein [Neptuniibacter sp. QD37_11]|uniref:hypothetical protein n=1 Tax=Neptuniibacter sp. QD37_11 TaxID=3398209 RepID=UPI0039F5389D